MHDMIIEILFLIGVALSGMFLMWSCYRNYQNRPFQKNWRMMTAIPGYGKYWGLASQGVMGAAVMLVAIYLPFAVWYGREAILETIFIVLLGVMIVASMVLSYWLPEKWIPQWLKDVEREEAVERERRRRIKQARRRR